MSWGAGHTRPGQRSVWRRTRSTQQGSQGHCSAGAAQAPLSRLTRASGLHGTPEPQAREKEERHVRSDYPAGSSLGWYRASQCSGALGVTDRHITESWCKFSVVQMLLVWAKVEGTRLIRRRCTRQCGACRGIPSARPALARQGVWPACSRDTDRKATYVRMRLQWFAEMSNTRNQFSHRRAALCPSHAR